MKLRGLISAILVAGLCVGSPAWGWDLEDIGSFIGNLKSLIPWGTAAGATPTIATGQYGPNSGVGQVVSNVNVFNGQPVYSISLGGISARGRVSFPVGLAYSGPVRAVFQNDNQKAPTGWIGMGWDLSIPFVAVNHKGTYTSTDDVVMCSLGPFGGGQVLQNSGGTFFLTTNPYIVITTTAGTGEFAGQIVKWTFTLQDGQSLVFGNSSNAQRTLYAVNGIINGSSNPVAQVQRFIYRWDLSSIADYSGTSSIQFAYQQDTTRITLARPYVRESHIKSINWSGPGGEVERFEFALRNKVATEYIGYQSFESRDDQRLYEAKALDNIKYYQEGKTVRTYKLIPDLKSDWQNLNTKSLLKEIQVFHTLPNGSSVQDKGWSFTYESPARDYVLSRVTHPDLHTETFTYQTPNFAGTAGDQDQTVRQIKDDQNVAISLPTDLAKAALWKNRTICDGRFCYYIVKDGDAVLPDAQGRTEKLYLEIHPNMGNYFDANTALGARRMVFGDAATKAFDLDVYPNGDSFLLVNRRAGKIDLWEWNGIQWKQATPFSGDARYSSTNGFGHRIRVQVAGSYFLVFKTDSLTTATVKTAQELIPVLRHPSNGWVSLNRNSAACELDNKTDFYGENIRASRTTGACMEFNTNDLIVTASATFFTATHKPVDVMLLYAINQAGTGFTNRTRKLPVVAGATTPANPMNWSVHVMDVNAEQNYFTVWTQYNTNAMQVFYFDGDSVYLAGVVGGQNDANPYETFLSRDYFLQRTTNAIYFWQKKRNSAGLVTFERKPALTFTPSFNFASAYPNIRTFSNMFTIEFYPSADSVGGPPSFNSDQSEYAVSLFHVHPGFANGYADRTGQLKLNGRPLFNVTQSGSDNQLIALYGQNALNGSCNNSAGCTLRYHGIRIRPDNLTTFINPVTDIKALNYVVGHRSSADDVVRSQQVAMSNAARMIGVSALNKITHHVEYQELQWNGIDYGTPTGLSVVSAFQANSGVGTGDKDNVKMGFGYQEAGGWAVEFNSNTLTPEFELCKVKRTNSQGTVLGSSLSFFHMDQIGKELYGKNVDRKGKVRKTAILSAKDTLSTADLTQTYQRSSTWPDPIYVSLPAKQVMKEVGTNGAYRKATTTFHVYNLVVGQPFYAVTALGAGPHRVEQTIFDVANLPYQNLSYWSPAYPDTASLKKYNPLFPINTQGPFTGLVPISGSITHRINKYLVDFQQVWRDEDQNLTPAQMKTGTTPTFNINEGWLKTGEVTSWNSYKQVLESKAARSSVQGQETFGTNVYEGRRSDLVGSFSTARYSNCALLMAENGNTNLSRFDSQNRWAKSAGLTYATGYSHTGRYSIKVADVRGPGSTLALKDVNTAKFGFRFSAWIYAPTGSFPDMALERWNGANQTQVEVIHGQPIGGYVTYNQWQRWEVVLLHGQLTAGGLFTTSNPDFVVIWAGTSGTKGTTANTVYVDDLVALPSNASFTLATFNDRGQQTSATNASHLSAYYEYGGRGELMASRDELFRIHGQQGFHRMGEN